MSLRSFPRPPVNPDMARDVEADLLPAEAPGRVIPGRAEPPREDVLAVEEAVRPRAEARPAVEEERPVDPPAPPRACRVYTSDAADDKARVDLGGCRFLNQQINP